MYKHYIKIDKDKNVTQTFSSWQTHKFDGKEIFLEDSVNRHFHLNIMNEEGLYLYKYKDKKVVEKTEKEIYTVEVNTKIEKDKALKDLGQSDKQMSRALEDVIGFMIEDGKKFDKSITDLILVKKALREKL